MKIEIDDNESKFLLEFFNLFKDKIIFIRKGEKISENVKAVKDAYKKFNLSSNLIELLNNNLYGRKIRIINKRGYVEVYDDFSGRLLGYSKDYEEAKKMYK